jgi:hypothetical protein
LDITDVLRPLPHLFVNRFTANPARNT